MREARTHGRRRRRRKRQENHPPLPPRLFHLFLLLPRDPLSDLIHLYPLSPVSFPDSGTDGARQDLPTPFRLLRRKTAARPSAVAFTHRRGRHPAAAEGRRPPLRQGSVERRIAPRIYVVHPLVIVVFFLFRLVAVGRKGRSTRARFVRLDFAKVAHRVGVATVVVPAVFF